jgi:hypothetical protein
MNDSVWTGSVVVGDEAANGVVEPVGFPELPVVPDAGGESEQTLRDARDKARRLLSAVASRRSGQPFFQAGAGRECFSARSLDWPFSL